MTQSRAGRFPTLFLSFFALLAAATGGAAAQSLLRVPQDVANLDQAVARIQNGGVIVMSEGVYPAAGSGVRIQNPGKSFTVRAAAGARVVLDGGGARTILRLVNTRGQQLTFENLIFRNGFSATEGLGGAVTLDGAEASFVGCTFEDNRAAPGSTGGGAVRMANGAAGIFVDTVWANNTSPNRGGALAVVHSTAHVVRGLFQDNRVNVPGHTLNSAGGAILVEDGKLRVYESYFEGNEAGFTGGAIFVFGVFRAPLTEPAADALVVASTFLFNRVVADPCCTLAVPTSGGAIHAEDQATLRVLDSEFRFNRADRGGAIDLYRAIGEIRGSSFRGNQATAPPALVSTGGAINANSADANDPSTDFGAINRRSVQLTVEDSFFQGRFGPADFGAMQGGCLFVAGDVSRQFGEGSVPQAGGLPQNRARVVVRRTAFADCDSQRPAGAGGGTGFGGAINLRLADLTASEILVVDSDAVGDGAGGGAVAVREESVANILASTFAGNSAEQAGGALHVFGSELRVAGSRFFRNVISPGVSEPVTQSRGAAIFSIPNLEAGSTADVTGLVESSVFADQQGVAIFEVDQDRGAINQLRYNGNQFFESTFGSVVFVNILADRGGDTVAGLNSLVVTRSGAPPTDKSTVANVQLSARPNLAALLAAPASVRQAGDGPTPSFLTFAWNGAGATLDGAGLPTATGVRETLQAGVHTLRVGATTATDTLAAGRCSTGPLLCLNDDRFLVQTEWRDFQGNTGVGEGVQLTADTGFFTFFSPTNVELALKVLDGRPVNRHFWLFYGALSNVEYRITALDTVTGRLQTYFNPSGNFASVGDTKAFPSTLVAKAAAGTEPSDAWQERLAEGLAAGGPGAPRFHLDSFEVDSPDLESQAEAGTGTCVRTATNLCLNQNRFRVEVNWRDFQNNTGVGMAEPLTPDTGYFWFFNPANVEVVLKVLDGRPVNGRFWVFYGALSNVEYRITVTDTQTGNTKTYVNPSGNFASVGDTRALPGG